MPTSAPNNPPMTDMGQIGGGALFNPLRGRNSRGLTGGAGFNPLQAGNKQYGLGGGSTPNFGPVRNLAGYAERDIKKEAQRAALDRLAGGLK